MACTCDIYRCVLNGVVNALASSKMTNDKKRGMECDKTMNDNV